jgi:hypothetical protein
MINMTTEAQQSARLLKVFNVGMYSMIRGLWDIFGDSAFATTNPVGDRILGALEKETGLQINGKDAKAILEEITQLLVNDVGTMSAGKVTLDGDRVSIACKDCFLHEATGWLEAEGVQPFACIPMGVSAAAMRKKLGIKHRVIGRDWDAASQTCTINFQIIE